VTIDAPLEVRVGLATDLDAFELPCCEEGMKLHAGEESWPIEAELRLAPAAEIENRAVYRLQVAALKDEGQAARIASELEGATGFSSDAVFDAGSDLYRVRVGRFETRDAAETAKGEVIQHGLDHAWVVSEGGELAQAGFELVWNGERRRIPGREVAISVPPETGFRHDGKRYRGRLVIYLNDRGRLNLVDELPIEDYLRGVVPKEMGPELYRELEALKAQAVAARTYTVRNLGEFEAEGYDICSTPRCQVYGGMNAEHPFSDRAIAETAGQVVLYDGRPAETLYSATCGGHTENVEVVFPLKRGPYLRGVRCVEAGVDTLDGERPEGELLAVSLMRRLIPAADGPPPRVLAARLEHLALLAGLPVPEGRPRSLERREVRRFLKSAFDLALDPHLLVAREELKAHLADPPASWRREELRLAGYLAESPLLADPPGARLGETETEELLFELALYLGALRHEEASYLEVVGDGLRVLSEGQERTYALPRPISTFRLNGDAYRAADLSLMAGDRLDLYWRRGELLAVAQKIAPKLVDLKRQRPRFAWRRFHSADELRRSVERRYPGFPFEDFEVLSRGVSGRIGKLRLLGAGGRSLDVEGLAVRWTLDLPDTLFDAQRLDAAVWRFDGRGWGHGVGLCQAGTYGMAMRGYDYRHILEHYYRGIELGIMKQVRKQYRLEEVASPQK